MKKLMYVAVLLALSFNFACSQKKAETTTETVKVVAPVLDPAVQKAIETFVKGGDAQDVKMLESVLHPDYRVTINQFMGGDGVTIMKREDYLGMIAAKKMGGKPRTMEVKNFQTVNHTAQVHVGMESSELIFNSFITLVQDKSGKWSIINDAVVAQPKK
jgi:hypothetical protein